MADHAPPTKIIARIKSTLLPTIGLGLSISFLASLSDFTDVELLIAPLGASAILVWFTPTSPLARPRAVVGGSLIAAALGLACVGLLGSGPWVIGLAVALAIIAMVSLDVLHAPAGALPILISATHPAPALFLATLGVSTLILVVLASLFHRIFGSAVHPEKWL
jgi:CBS-domain-containing membrane protein